VVVARIGAVFAFDERQFLVGFVFGHLVVDGGVIDRDADDGVGGHVLHALAPVVDDAAVIETLLVFFGAHERHGGFLPACSRVLGAASCVDREWTGYLLSRLRETPPGLSQPKKKAVLAFSRGRPARGC